MKQLFVVTLMVCLPLVTVAQTQHITFKQNGESASFSDPSSNTNLTVSRTSSTNSAATASLNYSTFTIAPDFTTVTFFQITGPIPPSSSTAPNPPHLLLHFIPTN